MQLTAAKGALFDPARLGALLTFTDGPIAVAFSGGGDSTAVLHLAAASDRPVHAFIVDHGLRPESAAEARQAATYAQALGATARVLVWTGEKPATGVQAAARTARHRLLAGACRRAGIAALLLGHTEDDVAESAWMRAARKAEGRALAAMTPLAPSPVWPQGRGVALVRPYLDVSRAALRAALAEESATWIEDPSNEDPRFERVRARAALAGDPALRARLLAAAAQAGAADRAVRRAAAGIVEAAVFEPWGAARVAAEAFTGSGAVRALEALIQAGSGSCAPVAAHALARLAARIVEPGFRGATVAGARVSPARGDLVFARDPGALLGRRGGAAKDARAVNEISPPVWDGRFAVTDPPAIGRIVAGQRDPAAAKAAWPEAPAALARLAPLHLAPDGVARALQADYLGAEIAARSLFVEEPAAWCAPFRARRALGLSAPRAHIARTS